MDLRSSKRNKGTQTRQLQSIQRTYLCDLALRKTQTFTTWISIEVWLGWHYQVVNNKSLENQENHQIFHLLWLTFYVVLFVTGLVIINHSVFVIYMPHISALTLLVNVNGVELK